MRRLVPAVARSVAILRLFLDGRSSLSVPEISQLLDLPKSSCHELVQTLVEFRLLTPSADDEYRFQLGLLTFELGSAYASSVDLWQEASEVARIVGRETQETVQIGILDGTDVLYLIKVDSPHPVRLVSEVGARVPAHCTALGKAMLATLPTAEVRHRYGDAPLTVLTPTSIASLSALEQELGRTRVRGYAEDNCESNNSVRCIGAAIHDYNGEAVAALSVSVPTTRVEDDWPAGLVEVVTDAAADLSKKVAQQRLFGYSDRDALAALSTAATRPPAGTRQGAAHRRMSSMSGSA